MSARIVFTIVSNNYLPFARVLMASVKRRSPAYERIVILVDEFRPDLGTEDFEIVPSSSLPIPNSRWFHFKYTILELNTAVKPYSIEYLQSRFEAEVIVYLDPDTVLYDSLADVEHLLQAADIVLTPHLLAPISDDLQPGEMQILQTGAYNLGFLALRYSDNVRGFIKWWQKRLYDGSYVDDRRGLFTDQKWIDLVPGLWDRVHINRDPGYNVAYWNLGQRQVERSGGGYFVNGTPLRIVHFSGFDPLTPDRLSKYQNRFAVSELGDARELFEAYGRELLSKGYEEFRTVPYRYGRFANEVPLFDICRRYELFEEGVDPFSDEGFRHYLAYWNTYVSDEGHRLTRLAVRLHECTPQLRRQMPDLFSEHYEQYLHWFVQSAEKDYGIHELFIEPIRYILYSTQGALGAARSRTALEQVTAVLQPVPESLRLLVASLLPPTRSWTAQATIDWLNEPVSLPSGAVVTRIASVILTNRPDVAAAFPELSCGRTARFLRWILTSGNVEYGLADVYTEPLRRLVKQPLQRLAISAHRAVLGRSRAPRPITQESTSRSFGLNLIGYVKSEHGVGEGTRYMAAAARSAGIPVSINDFVQSNLSRQSDTRIGPVDNEFLYSTNLCCINADQTDVLFAHAGPRAFEGRYNIGYWAWELADFPDRWTPAFARYNEIWVPSTFCQDAIARKAPIPVLRIPHAVEVSEPDFVSRADFGLPEDGFVFLTMFDMLSVVKRKNPSAVIDAFKASCRSINECHLVVKINNGHVLPHEVAELRNRCEGSRITILDRIMEREEINRVLAVSDCFVSLHRSEGFGLGLAEAMYLRKPVIATGYSGNMDFTQMSTAFLVDYTLTPVGFDAAPYDADSLWAEPDIGHAAKLMNLVATDAELRHRVAKRGQQYIKDHFSSEIVGQLIKARLVRIAGR